MVNTSVLKSRAKENVVKKAYWKSIAFCIMLGVVFLIAIAAVKQCVISSIIGASGMSQFVIIIISIYVTAFLVRVFLSNSLILGVVRYFLEGAKTEVFDFNAAVYGFTYGRYLSVVKSLFIRDLFFTGWCLLFSIPYYLVLFSGTHNFLIIIFVYILLLIGVFYKRYEYSLMRYIVSENTDIKGKKAINLSKKMSFGYKKNMFFLDVSFFAWIVILMVLMMTVMIGAINGNGSFLFLIFILGYIFIIIAIIGLIPYYLGAKAQLYLELKSIMFDEKDDKEILLEKI